MKEYFSHDLGARHDKKVVALVDKYKSSGYGIFWATNEMMHEEGGKLELDNLTYDAIGKHLNEQPAHIEEVIKYCIYPLKLYIIDDEQLTSNRVQRNLEFQEEKKSVKAHAGRLGGIKSGESRRSKQNEAPLEANEAPLEATNQMKVNEMKVNEMKRNESKGNKRKESKYVQNFKNSNLFKEPNIPTFEDVHRVFLQNGGTEEMAHNFFDKNESTGWFYKGSPITNFSSLIPTYIQTWKKNEQNGPNKFKSGTTPNGSSISGTSVIPADKKYSGKL